MDWNPERYERFRAEREAPFEDLLGLIRRREGLRVLDLGCGTGRLTGRLKEHLPGATILGLDSSAEILHRSGAVEIQAFEKVYLHTLLDAGALLQWLAGTTLLPYLARLPGPAGESFLGEVGRRLEALYPDGPLLYTFRRIFLCAFAPEERP